MFRKLTGIVFEQLEVVFASMTKRSGYDLGTFSISHHLCFLRVTFLFATVVPFLAFLDFLQIVHWYPLGSLQRLYR